MGDVDHGYLEFVANAAKIGQNSFFQTDIESSGQSDPRGQRHQVPQAMIDDGLFDRFPKLPPVRALIDAKVDVKATVEQVQALERAGADIVRVHDVEAMTRGGIL